MLQTGWKLRVWKLTCSVEGLHHFVTVNGKKDQGPVGLLHQCIAATWHKARHRVGTQYTLADALDTVC